MCFHNRVPGSQEKDFRLLHLSPLRRGEYFRAAPADVLLDGRVSPGILLWQGECVAAPVWAIPQSCCVVVGTAAEPLTARLWNVFENNTKASEREEGGREGRSREWREGGAKETRKEDLNQAGTPGPSV